MNPILSINLGGYPFTIDDDAYQALSDYLKAIHKHFRDSEGYEEITSDIEARLAELFRERLGHRPIINKADVSATIAIMGTPTEFGAASEEGGTEPSEEAGSKRDTESNYRTGRRLYRNSDDEVVAGVCSGIAAYFGIADPIWVRIIFAVMAITGGLGVPLYFVLWVLMPKAVTASDRLAMRGEPINVSNIGRIIEEEVESLSKKVSNIGDELSSKFEATKKKSPSPEVLGNTAKKGISLVVWTVLRVVRFILFFVAIAALLAFTAAWISGVVGISILYPYLHFFASGASWVLGLGIVNLLLLVLIPIFAVALSLTNTVFNNRTPKALSNWLGVLWTINFVSLSIIGSIHVREFGDRSEFLVRQDVLELSTEQPVKLSMSDVPGTSDRLAIGRAPNPLLRHKDGFLYFSAVNLSIEPSQTDEMVLIQSHQSQGRDRDMAELHAQSIRHAHSLDGHHLNIHKSYELDAKGKWRGQIVHYILQLPVGASVEIDRSTFGRIWHMDKVQSPKQPSIRQCQTWVMTEEGLLCATWPEESM
jgi:phage shock protein PspC (stress-responsive transcriptional regulator)